MSYPIYGKYYPFKLYIGNEDKPRGKFQTASTAEWFINLVLADRKANGAEPIKFRVTYKDQIIITR